jgi:hypothetical protein
VCLTMRVVQRFCRGSVERGWFAVPPGVTVHVWGGLDPPPKVIVSVQMPPLPQSDVRRLPMREDDDQTSAIGGTSVSRVHVRPTRLDCPTRCIGVLTNTHPPIVLTYLAWDPTLSFRVIGCRLVGPQGICPDVIWPSGVSRIQTARACGLCKVIKKRRCTSAELHPSCRRSSSLDGACSLERAISLQAAAP